MLSFLTVRMERPAKGVSVARVATLHPSHSMPLKNLTTAEGGCITWNQQMNWILKRCIKNSQVYSLHGPNQRRFG